MEENKKNKTKKIALISIIVLILILGFIGYFIYYMTYTDNNGEDNIDDDDLKYTLNVYKNENNLLCKEQSSNCKDIAFSIPTKVNNAKIIDFDQDYLFVLYEDNNELKIFNKKLEESLGVSLEHNYKEYTIYTNNDKSNVIGIVYKTSDDKVGYFNVATGNKLYEGKYKSLILNSDSTLNACKNGTLYLLNKDSEQEELSYKVSKDADCEIYAFLSEIYSDKSFYRVVDEFETKIIYSNSKKIIYDKQIKKEEVSFNDGYLYLVENKKIKKYDIDGKLISTSKEYNNIKGLLLNYVIYVQDNYLMLLNIDNEEYKVIDKWNNDYRYETGNSRYYTREMLDRMGETVKPEGLYIVIYYKEQDKNGNYGIEYCYTKDKEIKTFEVKTPKE